MKKMIGIIIVSVLALWVSFGQTGSTDNIIQTGGETKMVKQAIKWETINDLNFLGARFCNDWLEIEKLTKNLQLQIQPGQKKEICMVFANIAPDKPLEVKFQFSPTTIDEKWHIGCMSDRSKENSFAKLIDQTHNTWFIIPANSQVVKRVKMYIPPTYTGQKIYGCLSYKMNKEETMSPWEMFLMVYRKTAPMEITVAGDIYRLWRRDDIKDAYEINKVNIIKVIIAILALWLILTIIQTDKKVKEKVKEKEVKTHKKK